MARFTQADITRALKGVENAGLPVRGCEIDPNGKIVVIFGDPSKNKLGEDDKLDELLDNESAWAS